MPPPLEVLISNDTIQPALSGPKETDVLLSYTNERLNPPKSRPQGMSLVLAMTIIAAALGGSFQNGFHTGSVNPVGHVAADWINQSHIELYGDGLDSEAEDITWAVVVGLLNVGGVIGSLLAPLVADRLGRRNGLFANALVGAVGICLLGSARPMGVYQMLMAGRVMVGISAGTASTLVPVYLTEIAPIHLRGALGSVHQVSFTLAMLVAQILGIPEIFGNPQLWSLIFIVPALPLGLAVLLLPFCPESVKFTLVKSGNLYRATWDLARLRGTPNIGPELETMAAEVDANRHRPRISILALLADRGLRWRLIVAIQLMAALQLSGINAVFYYSRLIFERAGLPAPWPFYATVMTGVTNFVMTLIAGRLMDHGSFGRRKQELAGLFGMLFASLGITAAMTVSHASIIGSYLSVAFVFLYIVAFATGPGPLPWFYVAEIFPPNAKASASSVAAATNWVTGGIVGFAFPLIINSLDHFAFLIFTCLIAFFLIFTYKFVPETQGKSIDEISEAFSVKK